MSDPRDPILLLPSMNILDPHEVLAHLAVDVHQQRTIVCLCGRQIDRMSFDGRSGVVILDLPRCRECERVVAAIVSRPVWAVIYANYDPEEVASLWATQELAQAERDRLNSKPGSSRMWEICEMTVRTAA